MALETFGLLPKPVAGLQAEGMLNGRLGFVQLVLFSRVICSSICEKKKILRSLVEREGKVAV